MAKRWIRVRALVTFHKPCRRRTGRKKKRNRAKLFSECTKGNVISDGARQPILMYPLIARRVKCNPLACAAHRRSYSEWVIVESSNRIDLDAGRLAFDSLYAIRWRSYASHLFKRKPNISSKRNSCVDCIDLKQTNGTRVIESPRVSSLGKSIFIANHTIVVESRARHTPTVYTIYAYYIIFSIYFRRRQHHILTGEMA